MTKQLHHAQIKEIVPHKLVVKRVEQKDGEVRWDPVSKNPSAGVRRAMRIFELMENYLEIRTKAGEFIQFRMNACQRVLAHYVAWCWDNGVLCWILLPKSRQFGTSTFWELFSYASCELFPGFRSALVAHTDQGANEIFGKTITVRNRLAFNHPEWFPELETDQAGHYVWLHGSAKETATIKTGDGIGKGGTLTMIHFSESANFCDKGVDGVGNVNSIMQSCAEGPYQVIVHESTAKGRDPLYYPMCMKAKSATAGSQFKLIFLPWFLNPEYSMSWRNYRKQMLANGNDDPGERFVPTEEEAELRLKLKNVRVAKRDRHWKYRHDLTNAQLIWRRWAITNKCDGKIEDFWRYYPSFLDEAFVASMDCKWSAHDVQHYRDQAVPPIASGEVLDIEGAMVFKPSPIQGQLKVWEFPRRGSEYVIGADIGGEKNQSDFYSAYVAVKATAEIVAHLYGHMEWDEFADHAMRLGFFYNTAALIPENNHRPAVSKRMHRANYPNLYFYKDDLAGPAVVKVAGFNTNKKTRPEILDVLDKRIRERSWINPDAGFPEEMEAFVWHPKETNPNEGTYKASAGNHDDRILSAAITVFFCDEPEEIKINRPKERPSPIVRAMLEILEADEEEELEEAGSGLNLGARYAQTS